MKKKLYGGLTAVLALCLTFTLSGCKDDKESSEEEKQQQVDEQADQDMADAATFWSVVGQLTTTGRMPRMNPPSASLMVRTAPYAS